MCIRDSGPSVISDADLSTRVHVKQTVLSWCFAAFRQLRQIRRAVPTCSLIPDACNGSSTLAMDYTATQYWLASQLVPGTPSRVGAQCSGLTCLSAVSDVLVTLRVTRCASQNDRSIKSQTRSANLHKLSPRYFGRPSDRR